MALSRSQACSIVFVLVFKLLFFWQITNLIEVCRGEKPSFLLLLSKIIIYMEDFIVD